MFGAPGGRADLDNLIKFALDAGNGFLYTDDTQGVWRVGLPWDTDKMGSVTFSR
jgi:Holliday junction resolvase RusA-like endonuclease